MGGYIAEAQQGLAFFGNNRSQLVFMCRTDGRIMGKEQHACTVMPRFGKLKAQFRRFGSKEGMRNLQHDPRAVAGVRLAALTAAMLHIGKHGQRAADDFMGWLTLDMGNETHTASIFFELRIIEALFLGKISMFHKMQPFFL
ncbi:Uncharacterised protein [Actinobacillus pleuropneumoniae]|nr:Uncharacterised protein [Actinobacillus pleuropneumoniae]